MWKLYIKEHWALDGDLDIYVKENILTFWNGIYRILHHSPAFALKFLVLMLGCIFLTLMMILQLCKIISFLLKLPKADQNCPETRIALLGNKDAGKSTLIHVLLKGMLDDGHGSRCKDAVKRPDSWKKSRCKYLSYRKLTRPNTSSINSVILGFDQEVSFLKKNLKVWSL